MKDKWILFTLLAALSIPCFMLWANVNACRTYFKEMNVLACLISTKTVVTPSNKP